MSVLKRNQYDDQISVFHILGKLNVNSLECAACLLEHKKQCGGQPTFEWAPFSKAFEWNVFEMDMLIELPNCFET